MGKIGIFKGLDDNKKLSITSQKVFSTLFVFWWTKDTILPFIKAFINRIPYVSRFTGDIISLIFIALILFSLGYITRNIRREDIIAYIIVVLICFASVMVFPDNKYFQYTDAFKFVTQIYILYFVGISIDVKKVYKLIYITSLLSVFASFVYQTFINDAMTEVESLYSGNMSASYQLLPHLLVVLSYFFNNKTLISIFASVLGMLLMLSYGTRGPVLIVLIFTILFLLFYIKGRKKIFFTASVVGILGMFLLFFDKFMLLAHKFVKMSGLSERMFYQYYEGRLAETSGRNLLYEKVIHQIAKSPFIGLGVSGDHTILDTYSHNIFLELFVSFGVPVGIIILIAYAVCMTKAIVMSNNAERLFILILFCSSFIKLFVSGSYLHEQILYLLIGIFISVIRRGNSKNEDTVN